MGKSKAKKPAQVKEVYHVEVITSARVVVVDSSEDEEYERKKKGKKKKKKPLAKWEYYVKWANYDSDANSWEPEENLEGCERLRESFWRHIGMDDRDYHVGYQVSASHAWIEKEKAFFKREFASAQEEIERHKKVVRDAKKARKRKSETLKQGSNVVSSNESSEDERPLQTILISPLRKRKRVVSSPSEDEETTANSRVQKYAKLNDSRSTAMDVEDTLPRADSPTSLFSAPSSPDVPLIDSFSSPVPTTTSTTAANVPSTAKKTSLQTNPLSQSRSEPTSGGGGISIKQRLGVGALAPTNPKMGPLPPPRRLTSKLPSSLAGIKIKKRTPSLSINTNADPASGHEPSLRSASMTMHSPHPTSNMSPNIPNLSPSTSAPVFTPNFYRYVNPNETISSQLISQPPAMEEAERFLQEIMPPGLADPILPAQEPSVGPPPPMALHPKPALPGRIPKRWQWQGPLYLETSLFCSVRIHNSTDPKPSEMRFSVAFEGVTDLSMTTIHNIIDLRKILPAFRPWTQLACLSPQEEEDNEPFKILCRYLENSLKVILRSIILDNNVVGQIFIFSPGLMNILPHFNLPSGFALPDSLVVALLPYSLSKSQLIKESHLANSEPHSLPTLLESDRWTRSIRVKPGYQHGLRILGFPEDLHNYMHDRVFTILWWNHQKKTSFRNAGLETKVLLNIMEQARAKPADQSNEARIVFVHVSALTSLHKLPGLVERRSQRPHIQFYTYGSHEDVSPSLWLVKEIYPCGGIITFSPAAMFHNPIEMLHKIKQIIAHPLWECYILPSALGMLAKMICGGEDPLAVLERGEFSHEFILKAIAAGEVALIHAPPEKATTHSANDLRQIWMRQYLCVTSFTAKRALEIGVQAFHSNYADTSESEQSQRMETEILTDLSSMQRQPAIMKDYRRYVVFISEQEARSSSNSGGLEWTTISKFDFSDNFHPKKQIINA